MSAEARAGTSEEVFEGAIASAAAQVGEGGAESGIEDQGPLESDIWVIRSRKWRIVACRLGDQVMDAGRREFVEDALQQVPQLRAEGGGDNKLRHRALDRVEAEQVAEQAEIGRQRHRPGSDRLAPRRELEGDLQAVDSRICLVASCWAAMGSRGGRRAAGVGAPDGGSPVGARQNYTSRISSSKVSRTSPVRMSMCRQG